jgi:hypothetical protein
MCWPMCTDNADWMKDNVNATAIQLDHHNKIMSNKSDLTDVLTGMSESGAIKAKGNMSSSSYSDKATKLMLNNLPLGLRQHFHRSVLV